MYCNDPLVKPATLISTHAIKESCHWTGKVYLYVFTVEFVLRNYRSKF